MTPKHQNFWMKKKKERAEGQETEFNPKNLSLEKKKHLNNEIKSRIEK